VAFTTEDLIGLFGRERPLGREEFGRRVLRSRPVLRCCDGSSRRVGAKMRRGREQPRGRLSPRTWKNSPLFAFEVFRDLFRPRAVNISVIAFVENSFSRSASHSTVLHGSVRVHLLFSHSSQEIYHRDYGGLKSCISIPTSRRSPIKPSRYQAIFASAQSPHSNPTGYSPR
jgi:hypothetical protein